MDRYRVIFEDTVHDDIKKIGPSALNDIKQKVDWLADNVKVIKH